MNHEEQTYRALKRHDRDKTRQTIVVAVVLGGLFAAVVAFIWANRVGIV